MNLIPLLDVRRGGPSLIRAPRVAAAVALRELCLAPIPRWSRMFVCHRSTTSPRNGCAVQSRPTARISATSARILGFPGALTLNCPIFSACTTSAAPGPNGAPLLRRSLDWPFDGLGRCVENRLAIWPAGDFYNVTWPGAVGVLSAMAPGRFCAVINQAPMRRRTRDLSGFPMTPCSISGNALMREDGWRRTFAASRLRNLRKLRGRDSAPLAGAAGSTGPVHADRNAPRRDGGRRADRARGACAARARDGRQRLADAAAGLERPDGLENNEARKAAMRVSPRRPGVPLGRAARAERDDSALSWKCRRGGRVIFAPGVTRRRPGTACQLQRRGFSPSRRGAGAGGVRNSWRFGRHCRGLQRRGVAPSPGSSGSQIAWRKGFPTVLILE